MKRIDPSVPFIIYAGSNATEHVALARSNGAIGCTNDPRELFELVTGVILLRR